MSCDRYQNPIKGNWIFCRVESFQNEKFETQRSLLSWPRENTNKGRGLDVHQGLSLKSTHSSSDMEKITSTRQKANTVRQGENKMSMDLYSTINPFWIIWFIFLLFFYVDKQSLSTSLPPDSTHVRICFPLSQENASSIPNTTDAHCKLPELPTRKGECVHHSSSEGCVCQEHL